jgi:hypothetical protein
MSNEWDTYRDWKKDYEKQLALNSFVPPDNETIDEAMKRLPSDWQYRWCEAHGGCGCMGAANCSGRLGGRFTKAQWEEWVMNNPPPGPEAQRFVKDGKYNKMAHDAYAFGLKQKEFVEALKKFTNSED